MTVTPNSNHLCWFSSDDGCQFHRQDAIIPGFQKRHWKYLELHSMLSLVKTVRMYDTKSVFRVKQGLFLRFHWWIWTLVLVMTWKPFSLILNLPFSVSPSNHGAQLPLSLSCTLSGAEGRPLSGDVQGAAACCCLRRHAVLMRRRSCHENLFCKRLLGN